MLKARVGLVSLVAALAACAGTAEAAQRTQAPAKNVPMVQDWSTQRAYFSKPEMPDEARARGHYERWQRLAQDPRYMFSLNRRLVKEAEAAYPMAKRAKTAPGGGSPQAPAVETMHRDWSNVLGGGSDGTGGKGVVDVFPAKFSFDINATPSCANDFVVYGTNALGATTGGGNQATWVSSFNNANSAGTVTIGVAPRQVILTASTTLNTGLFFLANEAGATATTNATHLAAAVNRWTQLTGYTASSSAAQVTITAVTRGPAPNRATLVTEALSQFPAFTATDGTLGAGQASIIAFNQLYNGAAVLGGCNAGQTTVGWPNVYWAYNTGGTVRTSPVLSYFDNGQQVAFIQSNGGVAELVLLKWKAGGTGTPSEPNTPADAGSYLLAQSAIDYRNGTGPCAGVACMFKMPFSGGGDDLISSPFVDYFSNTLYVGDSTGRLHKFTGVFSGTPKEVVTGGFPKTVSAGNALSSPIYDFNNQIFVGSAAVSGSGGALHRVSTVDGSMVSSNKLVEGTSTNPGVRASPMLDVSLLRVYVFVFNDGGGVGTNCTSAPCRALYEFTSADNAGGTSGTRKILLGSGNSTTRSQGDGIFDNDWYADSTGSLYVCAGAPGNVNQSVIWKVPITAGAIGAATQGANVTGTAGASCSPTSMVKNGLNEYLYFSVASDGDDGAATVCTGACLYMYNLGDLDGTSTDIKETWVWTMTAAQVNNETVTINGTTLTCSVAWSPCGTGNINSRTGNLVTAINNVSGTTGITASNVAGVITLVRTTPGDVSDTMVSENLSGLSQTAHTDGQVLTPTTWANTNAPMAGLPSAGGSGGLIIDNVSSTAGASQVYYGQLGAAGVPGNAVQASQAGLQ
jgi:hypothetical protein